jgi:nitrite reductase/ring-hydroxylating ferredoxin subunit
MQLPHDGWRQTNVESLMTDGADPKLTTTTALEAVPREVRQWVHETPLLEGAIDRISHPAAIVPDRKIAASVPVEGEGGLFSQAWFPICLGSEVAAGVVNGCDFLDGRVVVWRDSAGTAHVTSAYCPHMGASLEAGEVTGDTVRCAFHHWEYNTEGRCVRTAIGDEPPVHACLFVFPTIERWGVVWAFNGEKPLYEIPDFPFPANGLLVKTLALPDLMPVEPWVQCANTPDIQHIQTLHRISFDDQDPYDVVRWRPYSMEYTFDGFFDSGTPASWEVGIFGTSLYYQSAWLEGRWFGFMVPMGLPRPGWTRNFMVVAVQPSDDRSADEAFLDACMLTELGILGEDTDILTSMRFQPGALTRSDRVLGKYFEYLRNYPRSHPSADWIR